ncbi:MAG: hypothetical protein LLG04_05000 [Parachlamydia sp.]|nr:hypothetical protein [Parachlamydia sp.]
MSLTNYKVAVQTVKGIANLQANKEKLDREHLTQNVYQLTGMSIHASENYPNVERFIDGIELAVKTLQNAYGDASTDNDKLRLFRHGLEDGGCFEARVETLYHYLEETATLAGSLKYEIMELNIRNNRPKYEAVILDDLVPFLQESQFFEHHHLDKATFKDHPVIIELQGKDLIASDKPKDPIALIDEAFSTYTDYGKGEDAFLNYLSQTLSNHSKTELKVLLNNYFTKNPERKTWL